MLSSINYSIQCFHEYTSDDCSKGGGPNEGGSGGPGSKRGPFTAGIRGPGSITRAVHTGGRDPNKGCSLGPTAGMGVQGPNEGCSAGVRGQESLGSK